MQAAYTQVEEFYKDYLVPQICPPGQIDPVWSYYNCEALSKLKQIEQAIAAMQAYIQAIESWNPGWLKSRTPQAYMSGYTFDFRAYEGQLSYGETLWRAFTGGLKVGFVAGLAQNAFTPMETGSGLRLVVGGGRASGFPKSQYGDITLNIDSAARPDVVGDIATTSLPSGIFKEIYFEHFPAQVFKNPKVFEQTARLIQPGGRVIIKSGADIELIKSSLLKSGFRNIHIETVIDKTVYNNFIQQGINPHNFMDFIKIPIISATKK